MGRTVFLVLALAAAARAAEPALRVGVVPDSPPFVTMRDGQLAGFTVDLYRAVAARMRRQVAFTAAAGSALSQDLAENRIDLLGGPLPATPERATDFLFGEGLFWTEYRFGVRPGVTVASLADLRGRRLVAPEDTDYAEWAAREAGKRGFTARTLASPAAVFDALRHGEADVSLTDDVSLAVAAQAGGVVPALTLRETRAEAASAFRPTEAELRDSVEDAIGCLKRGGEVAALARIWFGHDPGPDDLEKLVEPGYGIAGLAGYDPKSRKIPC